MEFSGAVGSDPEVHHVRITAKDEQTRDVAGGRRAVHDGLAIRSEPEVGHPLRLPRPRLEGDRRDCRHGVQEGGERLPVERSADPSGRLLPDELPGARDDDEIACVPEVVLGGAQVVVGFAQMKQPL